MGKSNYHVTDSVMGTGNISLDRYCIGTKEADQPAKHRKILMGSKKTPAIGTQQNGSGSSSTYKGTGK